MGRSELRACESLLRQAMVHLMKCAAWPQSAAAGHWRAESRGFLFDAARAFAAARAQVHKTTDDSGVLLELPAYCVFTLDALRAADPDPLIGELTAG